MVSKNKLSREQRQKEKADMLFMVYKMMGPERSLFKLAEFCTAVGLKVSEKTLKLYSAKFEWQRRLLELNAKEVEQKEKSLVTQIEQMNAQHAQFARGLLALAAAGLTHHQQRMTVTPQGGRSLALDIDEVIALFKAAQSGERLARGQATSRVEVWLDVAATVVREFGLIFLSVNSLPDENERKAEFIRLSDEMMKRYFTENARQALDTKYEGGYHMH